MPPEVAAEAGNGVLTAPRMPPEWRNVRRILVVRLDNIGDVILLGPALRALRQALPEAKITLMASPAGSQVAPMLPWVDDIMVHRAVWQDASAAMPLDPAGELALVEAIRSRGFDAALIFTSFSQSPYPPAYACYLAGVALRIGQSKEFGGSLLTQWVRPVPDDVHQADRNLHLLESAGFMVRDRALELRVPDDIQSSADQRLRGIGVEPNERYVVLAPGASCPARRYDPQRFAAVAHRLAALARLPIVVVGHIRERELVEPILGDGQSGIRSLVGQTSVPQLAAIIRRASLLIANDSGPMHMGDAFRTPMVILYSGTEYESQWRPRSAPLRLLRRPTECSPCYGFTCPYHLECLDFTPQEVVAQALDLLEQVGSERSIHADLALVA